VAVYFAASTLAGHSDVAAAIILFCVIGIFLWSALFFWVDTKLSRGGFIIAALYLGWGPVNLMIQGS
jgi:hypothetical protein